MCVIRILIIILVASLVIMADNTTLSQPTKRLTAEQVATELLSTRYCRSNPPKRKALLRAGALSRKVHALVANARSLDIPAVLTVDSPTASLNSTIQTELTPAPATDIYLDSKNHKKKPAAGKRKRNDIGIPQGITENPKLRGIANPAVRICGRRRASKAKFYATEQSNKTNGQEFEFVDDTSDDDDEKFEFIDNTDGDDEDISFEDIIAGVDDQDLLHGDDSGPRNDQDLLHKDDLGARDLSAVQDSTDDTGARNPTAIQNSADNTGARDPTAVQDSTDRTGATDPTAARDTTAIQGSIDDTGARDPTAIQDSTARVWYRSYRSRCSSRYHIFPG